MSTTAETIRNGVDTGQLFGTLDAIKGEPSLATFQFRARNRWIDGAHNRSTIRDFYAANQGTRRGQGSSSWTRASRRSCSAPTRARTRPSTCSTRSPPA